MCGLGLYYRRSEGGNVLSSVCVLVCLSVNTITPEPLRDIISGVPRTWDFRMGEVNVPQTPRRVGPLPSGERFWGGLCPLPRKFVVVFVANTIF